MTCATSELWASNLRSFATGGTASDLCKSQEFSGKIVELTAKLEAMKHKYNQNIELRESSFMEKRLEKLPRRSGRL
ncbi:hypothetical protein Peur_040037 [Populus x canadensis]